MVEKQDDKDIDKLNDKAVLDSDGILESEQSSDKAELDSDGILESEQSSDKAVLDTDGIFDGSELAEKEVEPAKQETEKPEQKDLPPETEKDAGVCQRLLGKLKAISLVKYSVVFGSTVVLLLCGWFVASHFLSSSTNEDVLDEYVVEKIMPDEIVPKVVVPDEIKLKTFIVPLSEKEEHIFLSIDVCLSLRSIKEDAINVQKKKIRLAIFNFLKIKNAADFSDAGKLQLIKTELKNILNNLLQKNIIKSVFLKNIMLF